MTSEPVVSSAVEPLLAARGIGLHFGEFRVLEDVSFVLPPGGLTGIVGTNGAGKSTLFAVVSGQLAAGSGQVRFDGSDITGLSPVQRARRGLGRTFQVPLFLEGPARRSCGARCPSDGLRDRSRPRSRWIREKEPLVIRQGGLRRH